MTAIALTLCLPLLLGAAALRALGIRAADDRFAFPAWCWLSGALLVAWLEALFLAGSLPLERLWLDGAIAVLAAGCLCSRRGIRARPAREVHGAKHGAGGDAFAIAILLGIGLYLVAQFHLATSSPIMVGDEASIWSSKAKSLYGAGDLGAGYARFVAAHPDVFHADYPPLNPLLQLFVFVQSGEIELALQRVPLQITALALLIMVAAAVRRVGTGWIAGLAVFALAGVAGFADHAHKAEADLCVAFGFLVALDAWSRFEAHRDARWVALCALGLGFAVSAKHEGALLAASFGAALSCAAIGRQSAARELVRRPLAMLWFLLPVASFAATWALNRAHGVGNDLLGENPQGRSFLALIAEHGAERLPRLAERFAVELGSLGGAGAAILPLCLGVGLLLGRRALRAPFLVPLLALAFAWTGYAAVYAGTPHDLEWHLATSFERIAFHLLPSCSWLAMAWLALLAPRARNAALQPVGEDIDVRSLAGRTGVDARGSAQ